MTRFTSALASVLAVLGLVPVLPAQTRSSRTINVVHTTNLSQQSSPAASDVGSEYRLAPEVDVTFTKPQITGAISPARVPAAHVPTPAGSGFASAAADAFFGFDAIDHRDQRLASNGNQFSVEPPDQGLAVGNGFVVEAVNDAVRVFNTAGAPLTNTVALNAFLGLAPSILRTTPPVFGPFVSDPRVYFDAPTGRFFLTVLTFGQNPATGAFQPPSVIYIAVSQTSDPTQGWNILALDVTNDGGAFASCPCFGDQPLLGADANGFYVSTNAFSLSTFNFSGANIYAMSKTALEAAASGPITAVRFGDLQEAGMPFAFSIQPATTPPGGSFAANAEYFVSALDFNNTVDNRLVVWALTGTNNLSTATLANAVVDTQSYGAPPAAQQQPGIFPLGQSLNDHEELVASNDDRLQQVVYAAGKLWTALNSVAKTLNGPVRTAAAWFILSPAVSGGHVSASVVNQGYVAINDPNQQNVIFPSVAVNSSGKGVITFSVVGLDFYPSFAYAPIDAVKGTGAIRIAAPGFVPDDGFSGYPQYTGSRVGRWGDYSAAVAAEDGSIWFAAEYIPDRPRTALANWGTFIGNIKP